MKGKDRAYWLADKIPAYGDYAKEAALVLRQQADEIERLRDALQQLLPDYHAMPGRLGPAEALQNAREALKVPNAQDQPGRTGQG